MTYKDFVAQAAIAIAQGRHSRGASPQYIVKESVEYAFDLADEISKQWFERDGITPFFNENQYGLWNL